MKKTLRKALSAVLLAVFLVSTALLLRQMKDSAEGSEVYREAQQLAGIGQEPPVTAEPERASVPTEPQITEQMPSDPTEPALETQPQIHWVPAEPSEEDPWITELTQTDLSALQEINDDVIGWILIPGTKINYPVLQGENNQHYLTHLWDRRESAVGSIFLESTNSPDFEGFHSILYGHNMNDGTMFGAIHFFEEQSFFQEHPYVYLVTMGGVYRYEIYAAHTVAVDNYVYALNLEREDQKTRLIEATLDQSVIGSEIIPAVTDRILTLSTCDGNYEVRWVVHARLEMVPEEQ